jgi:hypothetical protein
MENIENNIGFDPMIVNTNDFIIETYNELLLNRTLLNEARSEKRQELNDDDNISEIMNALDEYKQKVIPLKEKLKVAKEEFKEKNKKLFEKEEALKKNDLKLQVKLAKAYSYKSNNNDRSPILINDGKKELIINLKPELKKQKV